MQSDHFHLRPIPQHMTYTCTQCIATTMSCIVHIYWTVHTTCSIHYACTRTWSHQTEKVWLLQTSTCAAQYKMNQMWVLYPSLGTHHCRALWEGQRWLSWQTSSAHLASQTPVWPSWPSPWTAQLSLKDRSACLFLQWEQGRTMIERPTCTCTCILLEYYLMQQPNTGNWYTWCIIRHCQELNSFSLF